MALDVQNASELGTLVLSFSQGGYYVRTYRGVLRPDAVKLEGTDAEAPHEESEEWRHTT